MTLGLCVGGGLAGGFGIGMQARSFFALPLLTLKLFETLGFGAARLFRGLMQCASHLRRVCGSGFAAHGHCSLDDGGDGWRDVLVDLINWL